MTESRTRPGRRVFPSSPDSSCYYPATDPEMALARLQDALADDEGFLVVTGGPGAGKTLLGHVLVERLGKDWLTGFLTNSHYADRVGVLQAILYEFSQPFEKIGEQELRLALTEFLLKNYADGKKTLLIVDEAHHLSMDLLEEFRLLGNLEARGGKAWQILFMGQPSLLEMLARPELAALNQRITLRVCLECLGLDESADYLKHLARRAGHRPETIITDEAVELIARAAGGIPRVLNQVAHRAYRLAEEADALPVDAEAALEALDQLGLEAPPAEEVDSSPVKLVEAGEDEPELETHEGVKGPHLGSLTGDRIATR